MSDFNYAQLLTDIHDVKTAARSKGLAKLGDEIVNMCYSLAFSLFKGAPTGDKVSGIILSEALKQNSMRDLARTRAEQHDIADAAEALIAYAFLLGKISCDEMIEAILTGLQTGIRNPTSQKEKRETDIKGCSNLMKKIREVLIEKPI